MQPHPHTGAVGERGEGSGRGRKHHGPPCMQASHAQAAPLEV